MSLNESYPQHVVTAVIVAHDGAAWLPRVADALLEQTRPVQRVVAVDTGSRDRGGAVLAAKFGQAAVFGMDRATGYGSAIARALQHRTANTPVPGSSGAQSGERVEWLWLLHDDCEPAPDALEQLLRGAAETSAAAVLGPKIRDWSNREVILEAGVTLDTAARRLTGIEPREVDQGQHDGDRDALAVSSAGMLVRRDVWEQVGGFDTAMGLFMEDIDFCWRVHAAGYRVRVITDAVAYHVQAAARHRRPVSVGRRVRMLDRRNGLLTLLGNLPFRQMVTSAVGNALVSLLRISFFLLAKRLIAALDEAAALAAALGHPLRLLSTRRRRSRGRRAAYSRIRADLPPGRSVRRLIEFAASTMLKSGQLDTAGAHHASADPTDDDSMLVDNGLTRRLLTSPTVLMVVALVAVALVAGRSLIGAGGPLGGGSLVPAWGGASDLWHTYLQAFHPSGVGSTTSAPPFLAVIAGLAMLLGGKPWLAIDVILIGCVPLAGISAMLAARRVTKSAKVRVWAAVSYALLPVAMGAVAAGRFGTAVVFVLLPLIALHAARVCTARRQVATRAAWAIGLLVTIGAMFVPLLWLVALLGSALMAIAFRNTRPGLLRNLAIVVLPAPVLLLPWTMTLIAHPAELVLEAGLQQPGTATAGLPARSLMLLSPGGPGLPPYWVTAGLLLAALAALLAGRRRRLIMVGWGIAMSGLLAAIVLSRVLVTPAGGGPAVAVWSGLPLAMAALGLLLAATVGADALGRLLAGRSGLRALASGRGAWAALIGLVACSAPLLAAAWWVTAGVTGPVRPVTNQLVPELVAMTDGQSRQVRTLVLRTVGDQVNYLLLRGPSPSFADAVLAPPAGAQRALNRAVAALIAPGGGTAVNQSQLLADLDIGYVLVQAPVSQQLADVLNDVSGLRPYSTTSRYSLWQLDTPPARVIVVEPNGTVVPIPSGPVSVSGAKVPAAGGTLVLAEPAGGWSAAVDGRSLTSVPSPTGSWAQAFSLPSGGGSLTISHAALGHDLALALEALAFLAVIGLALPGVHVAEQDAQHVGSGRDAESSAASVTGAGDEEADSVRGDAGAGRPLRVGSKAGRAKAGRAKAGRGLRHAGSTRVGRDSRGRGRAGRKKVGPDRIGRDRTDRDKTGRDQSGAQGPPGVRPAAAPVRSAGSAGQRGAKLADAWPYSARDDDLDDQYSDRTDEAASGPWPDHEGEDYEAGDWSGARRHADAGSGRDADQPAGPSGRVPSGAWPYADAEPDREWRPGSPVGSVSGRVPSSAWPDPDAGAEPDREWRPGSPVGSVSGRAPSGAWPDPDAGAEPDRDRRPSAPVSSPSGRVPSDRVPSGAWPDSGTVPGRDQRFGAPVSSPSGRVPSGAWPDSDAGAEQDRDRRASAPVGSSSDSVPSGAWRYPVGDDVGQDSAPRTPSGSGLYQDELSGDWTDRPSGGRERRLGASPADRPAGPANRRATSADRRATSADRPATSADRPASPADRGASQGRSGWRLGAGRFGRSADAERTSRRATGAGGRQDRGERPRGTPGVGVQPSSDDLADARDSDRSDRRDSDRSDRRDSADRPARWDSADRPARWDSADRPERWDSTDRPARRDSTDRPARWDSPDRPARRDRAERSARPDSPDEWRSDRDDRPVWSAEDRPSAGRRAAESIPAWPGGGGDALEPLPPLDGPGRSASGRDLWRPESGPPGTSRAGAGWDDAGIPADDWRTRERPVGSDHGRRSSRSRTRGELGPATSGDWERLGGDQAADHRWPTPEPEPEYEGDGW